MRGVKIDFTGAAPVFDFSNTVQDFNTTVQNSMVNLATQIGSDTLYPDKGTNLLMDAVQGLMINQQWANNSANFAAIKTIVFSQNNDLPGDPFSLQTLSLTADVFNIYNLNFSVTAVCVDGTVVGATANIQTQSS
jgi:hypothetical protein